LGHHEPLAVRTSTYPVFSFLKFNEYGFYKSNRFYQYHDEEISKFLIIVQPDMLRSISLRERIFPKEICKLRARKIAERAAQEMHLSLRRR
jgi:hypothetical protein